MAAFRSTRQRDPLSVAESYATVMVAMRPASFLLCCLTLTAQNLPSDREAAIGRALAQQLQRSTTPVESQAVRDYVSQLGARVAAQFPKGDFPFAFSAVDGLRSLMNEPVVLPGGNIFVPLSLLTAANNEAEFAGMLAQAIARGPITAKSGAGTIPLYFAGDLSNASGFLPVSALKEWPAIELRADTAAVIAMSAAGFDPLALLDYIERVQPVNAIFTPLPPRAERIAALEKTIRELPSRASFIEDSSEFSMARALARADSEPPARPRPSLEARPAFKY